LDFAVSPIPQHGIFFADAVSALSDELAVTIEDDRSEERRWVTRGRDLFGRTFVAVFSLTYS
jgi:uncharacterized DUF497 family protein